MKIGIITLALATFATAAIINGRAPYEQNVVIGYVAEPISTPCDGSEGQEASSHTTAFTTSITSIVGIQTTSPPSNFTTTFTFVPTLVTIDVTTPSILQASSTTIDAPVTSSTPEISSSTSLSQTSTSALPLGDLSSKTALSTTTYMPTFVEPTTTTDLNTPTGSFDSDRNNCGVLGNVCESFESCVLGACDSSTIQYTPNQSDWNKMNELSLAVSSVTDHTPDGVGWANYVEWV
jgi:hypothetical protein